MASPPRSTTFRYRPPSGTIGLRRPRRTRCSHVHNAQVAAGLPRFRPHDLRHTHASLLIDLDAHPKAISERMGHSEIGVTMNVYGHLFQDKQEKLTNDLDALVERTRRPGRPEPSTVAITRSK
ncbi:MAG: tyrosine-type recombinase/integrase [Actinobacteria bacterium]|nr:tyrosine-type recombinase/integrase [Actinomycetota bacterium]MBI3256780.1 tyrosine-type recombinase/integrase [Actinomycetota bacterium]